MKSPARDAELSRVLAEIVAKNFGPLRRRHQSRRLVLRLRFRDVIDTFTITT